MIHIIYKYTNIVFSGSIQFRIYIKFDISFVFPHNFNEKYVLKVPKPKNSNFIINPIFQKKIMYVS